MEVKIFFVLYVLVLSLVCNSTNGQTPSKDPIYTNQPRAVGSTSTTSPGSSSSSGTFAGSSSGTSYTASTSTGSSSTTSYAGTTTTTDPIYTIQLKVKQPSSRDLIGRQSPSLETFSSGQVQAVLSTKAVRHGLQFASNSTLNGITKYGYYQTYLDSSLEVLGGELIIITFRTSDGNVSQEIIDHVYDMVNTISLSPVYTSDQAVVNAKTNCIKCTNAAPLVRLAVYPTAYSKSLSGYNGAGYLVWRVTLKLPTDDIVYFIDAKTGNIVGIQDETRKYTAQTLYSGTKDIPSYYVSSLYFLEDLTKNTSVVGCTAGNCSVLSQTYDADGVWDTPMNVETQVMYGVSQVLSYLLSVHGRDGIDGSGGPSNILSADGVSQRFAHKVHAGINQTYAQWSSNGITYGDGDGTTFAPMVSVDIVAHEMAHGVLQYTANLNGAGEPGALEESFGDVMAALVDRYYNGERNETWKFGEDVYTPSIVGDAIRYLDNPHLANNLNFTSDDDPDHYSEMYNGTADNGGIHTNAGIPNKAFYLLAKGGVHHMNTSINMTGIGIDAAAAIWWRAYTFYSSSTTTFADLRDNMQRSARDLYGDNENFQVGVAWGLCGVGTVPTPVNNQRITNPTMESATGWTLTQITGTGVTWVQRATDARSGVKYMKFGAANSVAGSISTTFSIPPTAATATLSYFSWVTGTDSLTVANDKLFVELYTNDTSNTLIAQIDTISNRNVSTTWYERTVNLMNYQSYSSLKLMFRVLNDFNLPTSFKVDDITVNCNVYK